MIRTTVYFRPDERQADLVRLGRIYLSRTTDKSALYTSFKADPDGMRQAAAATTSNAMHQILSDFETFLGKIVPATNFVGLRTEEDIVEAIFRLCPTNLKHDDVETFPAEDFFVRAVRETDKEALKSEAVIESAFVA